MIKYYPYGDTRSGDVPTDIQFTGQRYDEGTGLYYYGARYYDPVTGRFISTDTLISHPSNPQTMNRYSYCLNNPVKYIDPSGHIVKIQGYDVRDLDYYASLSGSEYNRIVGNDAKLAAALCSNEYAAYSVYRGLDKETTLAAETMEKADDYVVNIESDPSLIKKGDDSNFTTVGEDTYMIQMNPDVYNRYGYYNPANGAAEIAPIVQNNILQITPPIEWSTVVVDALLEAYGITTAVNIGSAGDAIFHKRYEEVPTYVPVWGVFDSVWYGRDQWYEDHIIEDDDDKGYPRR